MSISSAFEGLVTIEAWDGHPDDPNSKIRATHEGANALTSDFKDYIMHAIRRDGGGYAPYSGSAGGQAIPEAFFTERRFKLADWSRHQITNDLGIYITGEDAEPRCAILRLSRSVDASTGTETTYLNTYAYNAANTGPVTPIFKTSSSFPRPTADVRDSNIIQLLKAKPNQLAEFIKHEEDRLSNNNYARFKHAYPASGNIGSVPLYTPLPIGILDGSEYEWLNTFSNTTVHAPLGISINAKWIGICTSSSNTSFIPVTRHSIAGGFSIEPTDYIRVRYRVITKQKVKLPPTVTIKDVEVFGKTVKCAEITTIDLPANMRNSVSLPVVYEIPEYVAMIKRLATTVYGEVYANTLEQTLANMHRSGSVYYYNQTGKSLIPSLCGTCYPTGATLTGLWNNSSLLRTTDSGMIAEDVSMLHHTLPVAGVSVTWVDAVNTFYTEADFTSADALKEQINVLNNVYATTLDRHTTQLQFGLGSALTRKEVSGTSTTVSNPNPTPYSTNTTTNLQGEMTNAVINHPATTRYVWSSRGWYQPACCINQMLNVNRIVLFSEILVKDHLNSFVASNVTKVYHPDSTVDDSGAFLEDIRKQTHNSSVKMVLDEYDEQSK